MIQIQLTQQDQIRQISVRDKLREAGYTRMNPLRIEHDILLDTNADLFCIWPSIGDLLFKRFRSNYTYPWQRHKEILFRSFM